MYTRYNYNNWWSTTLYIEPQCYHLNLSTDAEASWESFPVVNLWNVPLGVTDDIFSLNTYPPHHKLSLPHPINATGKIWEQSPSCFISDVVWFFFFQDDRHGGNIWYLKDIFSAIVFSSTTCLNIRNHISFPWKSSMRHERYISLIPKPGYGRFTRILRIIFHISTWNPMLGIFVRRASSRRF